MADIPNDNTYLLIRSRVNRTITTNQKLWERLARATVLGQHQWHIPVDSHRKLPVCTATMEVRCVVVDLKSPRHDKKTDQKPPLSMS